MVNGITLNPCPIHFFGAADFSLAGGDMTSATGALIMTQSRATQFSLIDTPYFMNNIPVIHFIGAS